MAKKVLIIDDDTRILQVYQDILTPEKPMCTDLESLITGKNKSNQKRMEFEIATASQGESGVQVAKAAKENGSPFQVAFVDMRMPPGEDGLATARELRRLDDNIYIVIVTAYADRSIDDLQKTIQHDIMLIRKPFNNEEIYQMARNLCNSWHRDQELQSLRTSLELQVEERTKEINQAYNDLAESHNELKKTKAQLMETSKLMVMGELMRNIAHQWRQPLSTLGALVEDILEANQHGELDEKYLQRSVERFRIILTELSTTIDNFRNFFRVKEHKSVFNIKNSIKNALSIITAILKEDQIKIILEIDENITYHGYPNKFGQVILHLLSNAKDVLQEKEITDPWIKIEADILGQDLHIAVTDNGGGIPPKIKNRIFEPYFSTKSVGKDSGIGLYISKTFVEKNMGGKIVATNTENGARFNIALPLIK